MAMGLDFVRWGFAGSREWGGGAYDLIAGPNNPDFHWTIHGSC